MYALLELASYLAIVCFVVALGVDCFRQRGRGPPK